LQPVAQVRVQCRDRAFIPREVVVGEDVAPATVGPFEEEPIRTALEHDARVRGCFGAHRVEADRRDDFRPGFLVDENLSHLVLSRWWLRYSCVRSGMRPFTGRNVLVSASAVLVLSPA
jgi:hypothetical protein